MRRGRGFAPGNHAFFDGVACERRFPDRGIGWDSIQMKGGNRKVCRRARPHAGFKGFNWQLVRYKRLAALAEAAFMKQARQGFLFFFFFRAPLLRGGEVDCPKSQKRGSRIWNWRTGNDGRVLVDFGTTRGARVGFQLSPSTCAEMEFPGTMESFAEDGEKD